MARKSKATIAAETRSAAASILDDLESRAVAGEPLANLHAELDRELAKSGGDPATVRFQRKQLTEAARLATHGTPWQAIREKLDPIIAAYGVEPVEPTEDSE